jgi:2-polyprenyl-3-methyl-5-hydroxy-6-metoxy-1,4-benzoquinol methylase
MSPSAGAEALIPTEFPELSRLVGALVEAWPQHVSFMRGSFAGYGPEDLGRLDDLARRVLQLAGSELQSFIASYRWMCAELNKEAFYFKKHHRYRLATFEEAYAEVYSNAPFMRRYVEGILLSQVFWRNHSAASLYFQTNFLPSLPSGYRYLEIGPGHGLFLSVAAEQPACGHAEAWDVSDESLRQTAAALERLGVQRAVQLLRRDVMARQTEGTLAVFDGIAISEVLEHLERPGDALAALRRHLKPEGRIFINVPINSPAPDHIYLLSDVAAVRDLVETAGLRIDSLAAVPMTGYSVAQAEAEKATISCLIVAR